jgi:hypothetical protein
VQDEDENVERVVMVIIHKAFIFKQTRHASDRFYSLHGFLGKSANMSQFKELDVEKKDDQG